MSGVELQQRLSAEARELPIIFITALDDDDETRQTALRHGAVDYLRKPFARDRLLRSVRLAIGDGGGDDDGGSGPDADWT
jgi:FixJ family two-component response regulator